MSEESERGVRGKGIAGREPRLHELEASPDPHYRAAESASLPFYGRGWRGGSHAAAGFDTMQEGREGGRGRERPSSIFQH